MNFHELPDDTRAAFRRAIEAAGGLVRGYHGPAVQVAIPRPSAPFFQAMDEAGLELLIDSLHHFPLGTDAPPDRLRHGRPRGYWLFANFVPREGGRP
jgi:hypothetical protein